MKRPDDKIVVLTDAGQFDDFESIELSNDFSEVASCRMTFGNDTTWNAVSELVYPGEAVRVTLNGTTAFSGRFEQSDAPTDAQSGTKVSITARSNLSDARVASADCTLSFRNCTIHQFIVKLFAPVGFHEEDFVFDPLAELELATGMLRGRGVPLRVDMDKIPIDQLKVNPPETVWEVAMRVLKLYGATMWDGFNGKICVGAPDNVQPAMYTFRCHRDGRANNNNVISIKPGRNWSELPSRMVILGQPELGDQTRKRKVRGQVVDQDVLDVFYKTNFRNAVRRVGAEYAQELYGGRFNRDVFLPIDGVKTTNAAITQAKREMATRSKSKQSVDVELDGWSWWTGMSLTPYAINAMASIETDAHVDLSGLYLVHKMSRSFSVEQGTTTHLSCAVKGAFDFTLPTTLEPKPWYQL